MKTYNTPQNIIFGRNAVSEALRSGREIDKLLLVHNPSDLLKPIIAKCRKNNILIKEVAPQKLDSLCNGGVHQGVAIVIAEYTYCSVDDILCTANKKNEDPFIIICDGIEDPHNLGAIIRTAEAAGVHGVIIPKHRNVGITPTVAKTACGALEYVKVARVTNLVNTINNLKNQGVWIFAADIDGQDWCKTDFTGGCAVVIGSEGNGVSQLVKRNCDSIVSLPMCGNITSLNASVAAGIIMYEITRQRLGIHCNTIKKD
ncbi:MAG: 23S rRNA (guanosine(2251)-2'-O)-methyltransferase RlmB [bacterium]|nr:23S rRNA (guanosine(2251)-2'-O)-methyltransferase RlmB [bacterium]